MYNGASSLDSCSLTARRLSRNGLASSFVWSNWCGARRLSTAGSSSVEKVGALRVLLGGGLLVLDDVSRAAKPLADGMAVHVTINTSVATENECIVH